jgi:hypothetical protein
MHKPTTIPRLLPKPWRKPIRTYAITVGEVIWASNFAHASFGDLFAILVAPSNLDIGYSIWHSMQSDKGQLEALSAAANSALSIKPRMLKAIQWAKQAADDLAVFRNDAAHASTAFTTRTKAFEVIPNPINNTRTRLARLEKQTDIPKVFRIAKSDLFQLGLYVNDLFCFLAFPELRARMPKRPRLALTSKRKKKSSKSVPARRT